MPGSSDPDAPGMAGPAARLPRVTRLSERAPRPYPKPLVDDPEGREVAYAATRCLVAVNSREDAAQVLQTAVRDLGGALVPARHEPKNALPLDVSLGTCEPLLVVVDPCSVAALRLTVTLPQLLQDAHAAAARADRQLLQHQRAARDPLTGVASRGEIGPRLMAARAGDVVALVDLDHFKSVNDTFGHAAGDALLQDFGRTLRDHTRADDFCARYGGDEFLLLLTQPGPSAAEAILDRLVRAWGSGGTTLTIGACLLDQDGAQVALGAADRALYRAKRAGRHRVAFASAEDTAAAYEELHGPHPANGSCGS